MQYDLLFKTYDYYCTKFIEGEISYELFIQIENQYLIRRELFTINLN